MYKLKSIHCPHAYACAHDVMINDSNSNRRRIHGTELEACTRITRAQLQWLLAWHIHPISSHSLPLFIFFYFYNSFHCHHVLSYYIIFYCRTSIGVIIISLASTWITCNLRVPVPCKFWITFTFTFTPCRCKSLSFLDGWIWEYHTWYFASKSHAWDHATAFRLVHTHTT